MHFHNELIYLQKSIDSKVVFIRLITYENNRLKQGVPKKEKRNYSNSTLI